MAQIILEGWKEGFEKVSFTKIQMNILGKSIKESKENTDLLLEGKVIIIESENLESIKNFISEVEQIGVMDVRTEY